MIWRSSYRKIIYWVKFCTEVWSLLKKRRLCSTSSNFQNIKSKIKKKKNSKTNESVWLTCTERWKIDKNCSHFLCLKISKKKNQNYSEKCIFSKSIFFRRGRFFSYKYLGYECCNASVRNAISVRGIFLREEENSSYGAKNIIFLNSVFWPSLFLHVFFVTFVTFNFNILLSSFFKSNCELKFLTFKFWALHVLTIMA